MSELYWYVVLYINKQHARKCSSCPMMCSKCMIWYNMDKETDLERERTESEILPLNLVPPNTSDLSVNLNVLCNCHGGPECIMLRAVSHGLKY